MKLNFLFVVSIFVLTAFNTTAQKVSDLSEETGFGVSEKPLNCEMSFQRLEQLRNAIQKDSNQNDVLILIARLGKSEKSKKLNRARLLNVREGLQTTLGIENKIVIAEGEKVDGFGRVEFYLKGNFFGALLAVKNKSKIKCDF